MSFTNLIQQYDALRKGVSITDEELAELIVEANLANTAHEAEWAIFRRVLRDRTDLDKAEVAATFRRCRITADLGTYPYSVEEFVPAFLKSRGHRMSFNGSFGNDRDAAFIINQMVMWSSQIVMGSVIYSDSLLKAAFQNWQTQETGRLLRQAYDHVRFDASADFGELERFAALVTNPTGDPEHDAILVRATVVALTNFIYRVKNHMRGRWHHSIHMMPIFYGPQGSGKTTAVRHLLSPLEECATSVGFDILEHDAKMYQLSVVPVMFFDELAGISKAENERLKDIMHTRQRDLRKLYCQPSNRTLVSTFIGCSNKEIAAVIRDETGNRRYLQVETPAQMKRADIEAFDALAMWRAVDEDADAPLYANAADLDAINTIQRDQRHLGRVEHWIKTLTRPLDDCQASYLFEIFQAWMEIAYPGQARLENLQSFGRELTRLTSIAGSKVSSKHGKSSKLYTVGR
jgi:hypothetical protein